jgi:phosphodiesterase/alkaline phosphatase D-like protein
MSNQHNGAEAQNSATQEEYTKHIAEERKHAEEHKAEELAVIPKGRLRTFPTDPHDMKIIVLSCNQVASVNTKRDMWTRIKAEVEKEEVDLICHIGDQIYADHSRSSKVPKDFQNVWTCCLGWLSKDPDKSTWFQKYAYKILHLYRQLYRETWSHPPTAYTLSHVSNLMTYDDHGKCVQVHVKVKLQV